MLHKRFQQYSTYLDLEEATFIKKDYAKLLITASIS